MTDKEIAVLDAASKIYAGFAEAGLVGRSNHKTMADFSLRTAMYMAHQVDKIDPNEIEHTEFP